MSLIAQHNERLERAVESLQGLSVGDAFGERFFVHPDVVANLLVLHAVPAPPWPWTDDTLMALSVVETLRCYGRIEQDALAQSFAGHYDPSRGYGPAMHRLLRRVGSGEDWRVASREQFGGQGSYGNGGAMRVAPLGAYFADDLAAVVAEAQRSAEVTHAHPEGIAGAVAVAVAAALAVRLRGSPAPERAAFIADVLAHLPESEVVARLRRACDLSVEANVAAAVGVLGNGIAISAQDTVPFAIWCAATHLADYEAALWLTASGFGDIDTTCAIVGGIVAAYTGSAGIPNDWLAAREPLPHWPFVDADSGTVTLYRPVGPRELALIEASGYRAFPPRLPEQPIFYPVLSESYAAEIARAWNARSAEANFQGYVTRFTVRRAFLERFTVQLAGNRSHAEYWIPAADLPTFNANIIGLIEVIASFEDGNDAQNEGAHGVR